MLYELVEPSLITCQQNCFPSCETFVPFVFKNIYEYWTGYMTISGHALKNGNNLYIFEIIPVHG